MADTDAAGGNQAAGYSGPVDTSGAVNPAPPQVYQTFRYDFGGFSYVVPNLTPGAAYTVRLHFADRDHNDVGGRLMNVSINGTQALTNFDVTAAAGGRNRAVVEQFAAQADTSGNITIAFSAVRDYAFVNALEVIPGTFISAPTPTPTATGTPTNTTLATDTPTATGTPTQTSTPGPTSTPGSPTATVPPTVNPQEAVQANITSPAQTNTGGDPQVSGLVPVTGTADVQSGSGLQSYVVSYAPQNSTGNQSFITAFSGTAPVDNGLLGHFDTTALPNGLYTLQLVVTANDGQTAVSAVNVAVTGQLKIGNLSFTVTDLAVPVLGIPIQIDRTYDNFRRSGGDFGVDWTLGLHTVDVQQDTCAADVELTLPDGRRIPFSFSPQGTQAPGFFTPSWAPDPTTGDRLSTDYNSISQDSSTGCWVSPDDGSPYVPAHLYLDTPDGVRYVIDHNIDTFGTGQETSSLREIDQRNGAVLTFSAGGVSSNKGPGVTISRDGQGRITSVTDPLSNTITYSYDAAGDLASVTDRDGNATTYHYDGRHNLLSQTDPTGRTPSIAHYDDQGRLTSITDPQGHTITYTVDLAAHQQVVTDQRGNATVNEYDDYGGLIRSVDPLGHATTHTYDPTTHKMLSTTDPLSHTTTLAYDGNGNLTSIVDPLGNSTTYAYDANGRVLSTSMNGSAPTTLSYGPTGDPTSYVDPLGRTTVFTPNAAGLPVGLSDPTGGTMAISYTASGLLQGYTDAAGQTTTYTRDALGRTTTQTTDGQTTTYTYNNEGQTLGTTDALGHTTSNTYDAGGRLLSTTDPLSHTTRVHYDNQGRLIETDYPNGSTSTQTYDAVGNLASSTDQNGRTTRYQYDPDNRLIETDYPDGSKATVTYDAAGRRIATTDGAGNTTRYGYDDAGRPISVTDALSNTMTYSYDAAGNRASMTDPSGHVTTYRYDGGHRLIGTSSAVSTNGVTSTVATTTTYTALNQAATQTDADGRTTTYTYDAGHHLTSVTDAAGQTTTYTRDAQGNLAVQTDANGHPTTYTYDALNRPSGVTYADGSGTSLSYDAAGNVRGATNARGQTATYSYDSMNRVAQAVYPDHTLAYAYYPGGQTRAITDTPSSTGIPSVSQFGIDAMGRVITATTPQGTITYSYDGAGNRTGVTTPGGTTTYSYDADNRISAVTDPRGQTTTYSYDANGNLASKTLANGTTTTYSYDADNRLTGQQATTAGGTTLYQEQDTVDPAGLRTKARQTDAGGVVSTITYGYDAAGRLGAERQVRGTTTMLDDSYRYDVVGNRVEKDGLAGATAYQYNARDELTAASGPGGTTTYSYDADGNQTSRTAGGVTTLYSYDSQNRLLTIGVQGATTLQASYLYDALGNRVSAMDGQGHITAYLFDTQAGGGLAQVVRETPSNGTPTDYVYGLDRISLTRGSATSDYVYDGHGNTAALIDAAAAATVQDSYRYDAWGDVLAQSGSVANSFLYDGQQYDSATGLYYLRARYMDPATGRFLSMDPQAGSPQDPTTLHRYLYAGDDPVQYVDPSGQESVIELSFANTIQGLILRASLFLGVFKRSAQAAQTIGKAGQGAASLTNITSAVNEIVSLYYTDHLGVADGATALWGDTISNLGALACKGTPGISTGTTGGALLSLASGALGLACNVAQSVNPAFAPGLLPQMIGVQQDGQPLLNSGLNLAAYFVIQIQASIAYGYVAGLPKGGAFINAPWEGYVRFVATSYIVAQVAGAIGAFNSTVGGVLGIVSTVAAMVLSEGGDIAVIADTFQELVKGAVVPPDHT
ncbi:MAG: malectin domain-containing carbohydrate-binding protein [Chloroflexota bacterium]|nr:malectin domain-containing carbohydrate-binding protein [Chloroflexota bacterium]